MALLYMFVHSKTKLMKVTRLFISTLIICSSQFCEAQRYSVFETLENLQKMLLKYFEAVENKTTHCAIRFCPYLYVNYVPRG